MGQMLICKQVKYKIIPINGEKTSVDAMVTPWSHGPNDWRPMALAPDPQTRTIENAILRNTFEQPVELSAVLHDLCGDKLACVQRIAQQVNLASEVVLTSMGSALYSLMPMYEALLDAGQRNVTLVETAELIAHPERVSKGALYVLMSRSGESREVADFSRWLHERGYCSVGITMTPDSTMGQHSTIMLHDIASYDDIVCIKAYSSMALCGLFIVHMLDRATPDPAYVAQLQAAFAWMEDNKRAVLSAIEGISALATTDGFYLVSRGCGINMMRSASLWLEETAKVMANVMSIDNFFHGPMELIRSHAIVKPTTTPLMLDVCGSERSRMIWDRITQAVDEAIYVGPAGGHTGQARYVLETPKLGLDDPHMMLVQALFFQLLSYQTALVRGIEPGMFFDEGWVVK